MAEAPGSAAPEHEELPTSRLPGVIVGLIFLVTGAYMVLASFAFPDAVQRSDPGPAFVPQLVGTGLIVCAAFHLWQRPAPQSPNEAYPDRAAILRILMVTAALVVYALVLRDLGFITTTILFLIAALYLAHSRNLFVLAVVPIGTSVGLYFVFAELLNVALPRGLVEGLF